MRNTDYLEYAISAAVGSLVAHIILYPENKNLKSEAFAFFSGAFIGYIVSAVCEYYGLEGRVVGAIAGVSGSVGAKNMMIILQKLVANRLGISETTDKINPS